MTDKIEANKRELLTGSLIVASAAALIHPGVAVAQEGDGGLDPNSVLSKARKAGTLRMGYAQTAPWFYKDAKTGALQGIYFDVAEEMSPRRLRRIRVIVDIHCAARDDGGASCFK